MELNGDLDIRSEKTFEDTLKALRSLVKLNENCGRHCRAVAELLHFLPRLFTSDEVLDKDRFVDECLHSLASNTLKLDLQVPEEFFDSQSIFTLLLFLSRNFYAVGKYNLSERAVQCCIELLQCSTVHQFHDVNEELNLADLLFQLYESLKAQGKLEECVETLRRCHLVCQQQNDILFQAKVLYELFDNLLQQEVYDEAIESCLQLFVLKSDLEQNLQESVPYFSAIVPEGGGEVEIHRRMALAYRKLMMHDEAMRHVTAMGELLVEDEKRKIKLAEMRKLYLIGAEIEMDAGQFGKAGERLDEWLEKIRQVQPTDHPDKVEMEKQLREVYKLRAECCVELGQLDKALQLCRDWQLISPPMGESVESTCQILDVLLIKLRACGDDEFDDLRKETEKAARHHLPVDLSMLYEARIMRLEAEVLRRQSKPSQSVFRLRQALDTGRRCGRMREREVEETETKLALAVHNSTCDKELEYGREVLSRRVVESERQHASLRREGVLPRKSETAQLDMCYKALQVILHRLGENSLSAGLIECQRRRSTLIARGAPIQLPIQLKDTKENDDEDSINFVDLPRVLESAANSRVLIYSALDDDFLAHLVGDGGEVVTSYLLSRNVVRSARVARELKALARYRWRSPSPPSGGVSRLYVTENRHVAMSSDDDDDDDDGDDVTQLSEDIDCGDAALRRMFVILIQPFYEQLYEGSDDLQPTTLTLLVDGFLNLVGFEELMEIRGGRQLGDRFNLTISPNLLVSNASQRANSSEQAATSNAVKGKLKTREESMRKVYTRKELESLKESGLDRSFGILVTRANDGFPIMTSQRLVAAYDPGVSEMRACAIGSPSSTAPLLLREDRREGSAWRMPGSAEARAELTEVGGYMDARAVVGGEASKERFLDEFATATIIHLATFGSFRSGFLCFAAPSADRTSPVPPHRFLVSRDDLMRRRPRDLRLVVLSSCHKWRGGGGGGDGTPLLVRNLLDAGAQCVVYPRMGTDDPTWSRFLRLLYARLLRPRPPPVSRLLRECRREMTSSSFRIAHAGADVTVDLSLVRRAQLQSAVKRGDDAVTSSAGVGGGGGKEVLFHSLQSAIARLCSGYEASEKTDVVEFVMGLVVEATERLAHDDNCDKYVVMAPKLLLDLPGGEDLIRLAGFDLHKVASSGRGGEEIPEGSSPYMIVFPHWNQDELLLPLHRALTGLHELRNSEKCLYQLSVMLPLHQQHLCDIVDLLAVVKHSPSVQLRISYAGVRSLWEQRQVRAFLQSIGFVQIRTLLAFRRSLFNRKLLMGSLQLFISLCLHRDHGLLDRTDPTLLGRRAPPRHHHHHRLATADRGNPASEEGRAESLRTIQMPGNELLMGWSWMKDDTWRKEEKRRRELAEEIDRVSGRYERVVEHARWWDRHTARPRHAESQAKRGKASEDDNEERRVKVVGGGTPSCDRSPLERHPHGGAGARGDEEEWRAGSERRIAAVEVRRREALRSCYLEHHP